MAGLPLNDSFGNALVSFDSATGADLENPDGPAPMPLSLVVVVCASRVLMLPSIPRLAADDEILGFRGHTGARR